ncbi:hypothetical protein GGR57DRAFT_515840 [Xylariaceae sp. FL1272]|nr:hypothetical protein GGR57DRAFT_515840 [Xylariaceae sp. FL1272]
MALIVDPDFEPRKIFAAVSQIGLGGEAPVLDEEFRGGQCRIFKLSFQNESDLAVRVPICTRGHNQVQMIPIVKTEATILQMLEAKGFRWAPKCRGFNLSVDNPIRHPFIVLTWVKGSSLAWDTQFPQQPHRDSLLGQMASIQLSLIECTLETRSMSAKAYFERLIRNRRAQVGNGRLLAISEQDCNDQYSLLDHVLGHEQANTIFALDHGDLKPDNVIVDDKHNIQSVIDWGFAAFVPIIRAAGIPRFLWSSLPSCRPNSVVLRDRKVYTSYFASQSSQAALYMQHWQNDPNLDFQTLYLESLFSKGMHASMVGIGWKVPDRKAIENRDKLDLEDYKDDTIEAALGVLRG